MGMYNMKSLDAKGGRLFPFHPWTSLVIKLFLNNIFQILCQSHAWMGLLVDVWRFIDKLWNNYCPFYELLLFA